MYVGSLLFIKNLRIMTHASVFSGIGGPEVAATMLGWENLFHCEINPFGRQVLDYWFPNAESYEDITTTDFSKWRGRVDVLTGGFPCQPFSYAGKRRGTEDDRWLWPYMFRCIEQVRPAWVVAENVGGILTMVEPGEVFEMANQATLFDEEYSVHRYEYRQPFALDTSAQTLKPVDMPSRRYLFQLAVSEPLTGETESSLLPVIKGTKEEEAVRAVKNMVAGGLLNTPVADGLKLRTTHYGQLRMNGAALRTLAESLLLPTPLVVEREHPDRVENLRKSGAKRINSRNCGEKRPNGIIDYLQFYGILPTKSESGGEIFHLSPLFTEEMMGFPFGWTAYPFLSTNGNEKPSKPTATPSSPK